MKKFATLFFCTFFIAFYCGAQIFWTENFESGSTSGLEVTSYTTGPDGPWTQTITATEGTYPNPWYVSCAENGHTSGVCGTGCEAVSTTATGATLHVGADPSLGGDAGASYDAGGLCGTTSICVNTSRRAESPTINCTGKYGITMRFYYIMDGQAGVDYATVWYYDGTSWSLLASPGQTAPICPGGQGLWTAYSVAMPTSANNNPNVKIGFLWVNNDDGIGTDPSFAVDSVNLSTSGSTTSVSASFSASDSVACADSCITFTNTSTGSATSYTWSCSSGYTSTSSSVAPVTVCFSVAGVYTMSLTAVGTGSTSTATHTVTVNPAPAAISGSATICVGGTLTFTDATSGGTWSASNGNATVGGTTGAVTGVTAGADVISYTLPTGCTALHAITVTTCSATTGVGTVAPYGQEKITIYPNPAAKELIVSYTGAIFRTYAIYNFMGQQVTGGDASYATTHLDISSLPAGVYTLMLRRDDGGNVARKFVKE